MRGPVVLGSELALADRAAPAPAMLRALAAVDPLRLDLPPLPGLQAAPQSLAGLSALYLAWRLEEAGVLAAADALVRQRAMLRVPISTARRLEEFAGRQSQLLSAEQRTALFARLFGAAPVAAADPSLAGMPGLSGGAPATQNAGGRIEGSLAGLASAIAACGALAAGQPDPRRTAVAIAARDLANLAGTVVGGGALVAVPRLNDQLRRALELLGDPGIGALVGARGPWQVLRALLGANAPDLGRLIECGRHGQRLMAWLGGAVGTLDGAAAIPSEIAVSASAWLTACGIAPPTPLRGAWG